MTKIIFDIQRDNGYGKSVYLKSTLSWSATQNSVNISELKPTLNMQLEGPVEFNVEATDETFFWVVTETVITSGGTTLGYQRCVSVPDSETPVNYLDLEDIDPNTFFPIPEIA